MRMKWETGTDHQGSLVISYTLPFACLISLPAASGMLPAHGPSPKSAAILCLVELYVCRLCLSSHTTSMLASTCELDMSRSLLACQT